MCTWLIDYTRFMVRFMTLRLCLKLEQGFTKYKITYLPIHVFLSVFLQNTYNCRQVRPLSLCFLGRVKSTLKSPSWKTFVQNLQLIFKCTVWDNRLRRLTRLRPRNFVGPPEILDIYSVIHIPLTRKSFPTLDPSIRSPGVDSQGYIVWFLKLELLLLILLFSFVKIPRSIHDPWQDSRNVHYWSLIGTLYLLWK